MTFPAHYLAQPFRGLHQAERTGEHTLLDDWLYSIRWQGCALVAVDITAATNRRARQAEQRFDLPVTPPPAVTSEQAA